MIKVYFLQHKVHRGCFGLMGSSSSGGASGTQTPSVCGFAIMNKSLCSCTWSQERENSTGHGAREAGEVHPKAQGSFHRDSWPSFLWFTSRSCAHISCAHISLTRIQTFGFTWQQGRLGNVWVSKKKRKEAWSRASQSLQIMELLRGAVTRRGEDDSSSSTLFWMRSLSWTGFRE